MSAESSNTGTVADDPHAPLLRPRQDPPTSPTARPTNLALLIGRAAGRRGPSMLVREAAARELEERRADWAYSKPVVALDMVWNAAFVVVSMVMQILTVDERPNTPIRLWISVYALQCLVHVVLVWLEYRRRNIRRVRDEEGQPQQQVDIGNAESEDENFTDRGSSSSSPSNQFGRVKFGVENQWTKIIEMLVWLEHRRKNIRRVRDEKGQQQQQVDIGNAESEDENFTDRGSFSSSQSNMAKRCESVNTMASFLWWIVGFYWVASGGDILLHDAPRLYWLAVVFLAFDVFFAIFCVVLACLIGIALCCCLPCIMAILYAVAGQEGASEADLSIIPKYRFQVTNNGERPSFGAGKMVPVETSSGYLANERVLLPEDAECCICLTAYEDGAELHTLPCNHHFHSLCVAKWLKMNATCPLCKYNILKGNEPM